MSQSATSQLAFAAVGLVVLAAIGLGSGTAEARPRFGVQLNLGLVTPLDDYVTRVSLIRTEEVAGETLDVPYLGNYSNSTGVNAALVVVLRDYEISAHWIAFPWSDTTLTYRGDRPARRINGTEVDDGGANYYPLEHEIVVPHEELGASGDTLTIVTLGGGYRYYPFEEQLSELFGDRVEVYMPLGAGPTFARVTPGSKANIGAHMWAGVTSDVAIGDWAVVVDWRYNLMITERATGIPQGATNAAATDATIFSAMVSALHFVSWDLGLRYAFN